MDILRRAVTGSRVGALLNGPLPRPAPPRPPPVQTDPLTLSAWVLAQQHDVPRARGRLTMLINSISVGCKFVANSVRRVGANGVVDS